MIEEEQSINVCLYTDNTATSGTGPLAFPNVTIVPFRPKQRMLHAKVALPTPSNAATTPFPSVTSITRDTSSSSAIPELSATRTPAFRATSSFSSVLAVPMTCAPVAARSWQSHCPVPPAAAGTRAQSSALTGWASRMRVRAVRPPISVAAALSGVILGAFGEDKVVGRA